MTPAPRQRLLRRTIQVALTLIFVFFIARATVQQWSEVRAEIGHLDLAALAVSLVAAGAAVWCSYMSWNTLLRDLGHPVGTSAGLRVFFVGQLGKYLPGKLWPVVTQMRLGLAHAIDARSSAAAVLITMLMGLFTALLIPAALLPIYGGKVIGNYWWALLVLPPAAVLLWPNFLNRVLDRILRILKRPALPQPLTGRAVSVALIWSLAGWVLYGVHLWVLLKDLGAGDDDLFVLSVTSFAASWAVGFLLAIAPAGVGPREAAMVVLLTPAVGEPVALVAALVSRLLLSAADILWPAIVVLSQRRGQPIPGSRASRMR